MEQTIFPNTTAVKSKFQTYKWLFFAAIAVILYLAFCNKPAIPEPIVKTVKEQQTIIHTDTVEHKLNVDSIGRLISDANKKADYWRNAFNVSASEVNGLENSLTEYIAKTPIPDTCRNIISQIQLQFDRIMSSNKKAFNDCDSTIHSKDIIIFQKDAIIKEDSNAYRRMISNADTCLSNQTKLQAYIKKIRPRTTIYIGASAYGYSQFGAGINLGVMNRRGTMYQAGVMQLGLKKLNYSFTMIKPLVRL